MDEKEMILCPECFLPPAEEWHELSGLVKETFYTCSGGHCWHSLETED